MTQRRWYKSRLILTSVALPMMVIPLQAQTPQPAQTSDEVTFDKKDDLLTGVAAAARNLAQRDRLDPDMAERIAKEQLKDAAICAVPAQPSSADLYYRIASDNGSKFKHLMALTRTMRGYGGWDKKGKQELRELLCHLKSELGDKDQGFAAGDHYVNGGFSRIGNYGNVIDAVGTVLHENTHKLFHTANKDLVKHITNDGGDAIALNLLDEGNAFTRTLTSLFLKKIELEQKGIRNTEERALYKDVSDALVYHKSTRQALLLSMLVELHGKNKVDDHVRSHGQLPASINRLILIGFMDDIAKFKSYQHATVVSLRRYRSNAVNLVDGDIHQVMAYDGAEYYGDMRGIAKHVLPHLALMFAKSSDELQAGIEARLQSDKGVSKAIGDLIQYLSHSTQDTRCIASTTWIADKLLKDHKDSPVFKAEFIREDLKFLFSEAIKRIDAIPELDRGRGHTISNQLKNRLMDMVEHVQHVLLDGVPVNPAIINAPLPGLTKGYHTAKCG